jgi:cytochrome P450
MATAMQDTASKQKMGTVQAPLPPGPRGLPYFGNALSFRRDPLNYLQELQRTYGNIVMIHVAGMPIVLLFRPEYERFVLVEHPDYFSNRGLGPNNPNAANEGLLTIDGEKHRQQRRAVQPAFHKKQVEGYASTMTQFTQELFQNWHAGDTINISQAMQELTLRIACKCLFSIDLSRQLRPLGDAFNNMIASETSIVEDLLNIRIDNPITGYGKRLAATRQIDMLIYTMMAQRRDDPARYNDVLSMLMTAEDGEEPGVKLTDKQIRDHMLTFIAAGHETTANALAWTLYLLAEYPEVRAKLQDEINSVLGDRVPTVDDLARLPYLEWVLNESMRLYPPAWMQMRRVIEEFELDGVRIPANTIVMVSQWVIHRLPDIWEKPDAFWPERWDPANKQQIPPGAYFPFGAGSRICIGMPFAQLEARLVLAMYLQRYIPHTVPGYKPGRRAVITLRPRKDLRMILIPAGSDAASGNWSRVVSVPDVTLEERKGCLTALLGMFGLA